MGTKKEVVFSAECGALSIPNTKNVRLGLKIPNDNMSEVQASALFRQSRIEFRLEVVAPSDTEGQEQFDMGDGPVGLSLASIADVGGYSVKDGISISLLLARTELSDADMMTLTRLPSKQVTVSVKRIGDSGGDESTD